MCVFRLILGRRIYPNLHIKRNPNAKWNKGGHILHFYVVSLRFHSLACVRRIPNDNEPAWRLLISSHKHGGHGGLYVMDWDSWLLVGRQKAVGVINRCKGKAVLLQRESQNLLQSSYFTEKFVSLFPKHQRCIYSKCVYEVVFYINTFVIQPMFPFISPSTYPILCAPWIELPNIFRLRFWSYRHPIHQNHC